MNHVASGSASEMRGEIAKNARSKLVSTALTIARAITSRRGWAFAGELRGMRSIIKAGRASLAHAGAGEGARRRGNERKGLAS
jgi:hypothetical protein